VGSDVTDLELLRLAIQKSGLSNRAFADVLAVNERTVRRWVAEDRAIPGPVVQLCAEIVRDPKMAGRLRK